MAVLEERGVRPGRLVVEYRAPQLLGGSLDLVIDPPAGTVVEFKFPRFLDRDQPRHDDIRRTIKELPAGEPMCNAPE